MSSDLPVQVSELEIKPADADHPPPPIIVFAGVWMAYRPSPIIFPDRHADPGNQRRPDQGQLRYRQVKNFLAATSVKNFPIESPNKIICKQVCRLDSFTFGRFVVKCFCFDGFLHCSCFDNCANFCCGRAFFPWFKVIFGPIEANPCSEANCGVVTFFPSFIGISGGFWVLEPQIHHLSFSGPKMAFSSSQNTTF